MESKQELRDKIPEQEKTIYDLKAQVASMQKQIDDLKTRNASLKAANDAKENLLKSQSRSIFEIIGGQVQKAIDDSISKLSLNINTDYGGYVSGSISYDGEVISSDSDQVCVHNNSLDE